MGIKDLLDRWYLKYVAVPVAMVTAAPIAESALERLVGRQTNVAGIAQAADTASQAVNHARLGNTLKKNQQFKEAAIEFERALDYFEKTEIAPKDMANYAASQVGLADTLLQWTLRSHYKLKQSLPDSIENLYAAKFFVDQAMVNIDTIMQYSPQSAEAMKPYKVWAHQVKGQSLEYLERIDEAKIEYQKAQELDPDNALTKKFLKLAGNREYTDLPKPFYMNEKGVVVPGIDVFEENGYTYSGNKEHDDFESIPGKETVSYYVAKNSTDFFEASCFKKNNVCWSFGYRKGRVKINFSDTDGDGIMETEGMNWVIDPAVYGFEK